MTNTKHRRALRLGVLCLSMVPLAFAQTTTESTSALPRLVRFGGTARNADGSARTGVVGVTFALYAEQTGGAPLWQETQNLTADSGGHYSALLGSTKNDGLPAELFTSEQAHWVGVQVEGQPEQPRALLVSTPYALKAVDAETIGGLPPSAFMLAAPAGSASAGTAVTAAPRAAGEHPAANTNANATPATTTTDFVPIFTSTTGTLGNSVMYQKGTSIGIGTTSPAATLGVKGSAQISGSVNTIVDTRVDYDGTNKGTNSPGLRFGSGNTGEGIASDRAGTVNTNGIDLYTDFTARLSVSNGGNVGIANTAPAYPLDVNGTGHFVGGTSSSVTYGAIGTTPNTVGGSAGVYGTASATTSSETYGVLGTNPNVDSKGVGVAGTGTTISSQGASVGNEAGVWGDASGTANEGQAGVVGTADDGFAFYGQSNGLDKATIYLGNASTNTSAFVFQAEGIGAGTGGNCLINVVGDLVCSGTITPSVQTSDGHQVKLYTVAATENWFEDFGAAQLASGSARITLDQTFASTVNTGQDYRVFVTPDGDCKGLYVTNKTAAGFEVRELGGGGSNVPFEYRIVAKRLGYESARLQDVTALMSRPAGRKSTGIKQTAGPVSVPAAAKLAAKH